MDKDEVLDEIFNSDPMGLLDVKPKISSTLSADERLTSSFQEINGFFEMHNREPQPNIENISEYQLYSRLKSLRENEDKMMVCEPLDKYGLLKTEKKEIKSIDDVLVMILKIFWMVIQKVCLILNISQKKRQCQIILQVENHVKILISLNRYLYNVNPIWQIKSGDYIRSKMSNKLPKAISLY